MKSIFDKETRDELIQRINTLDESSMALWGKMTIYQMVKHCRLWEEMTFGSINIGVNFLGLYLVKRS